MDVDSLNQVYAAWSIYAGQNIFVYVYNGDAWDIIESDFQIDGTIYGMTVDGSQNVYVAKSIHDGQSIWKHSPNTHWEQYSGVYYATLNQVIADSNGDIYVEAA